jgi:hypothetical protein
MPAVPADAVKALLYKLVKALLYKLLYPKLKIRSPFSLPEGLFYWENQLVQNHHPS